MTINKTHRIEKNVYMIVKSISIKRILVNVISDSRYKWNTEVTLPFDYPIKIYDYRLRDAK